MFINIVHINQLELFIFQDAIMRKSYYFIINQITLRIIFQM